MREPTLPPAGNCEGEYGVDMVCNYKGVLLVLSSVGVERAGEGANRGGAWQILLGTSQNAVSLKKLGMKTLIDNGEQ